MYSKYYTMKISSRASNRGNVSGDTLNKYNVLSTARHAIHLQFDISARTFQIKGGVMSKVYSLM
jgi:hypothetical protein